MANNSIYQFERPTNEPDRGFMPGSPEKTALKDELARQIGRASCRERV